MPIRRKYFFKFPIKRWMARQLHGPRSSAAEPKERRESAGDVSLSERERTPSITSNPPAEPNSSASTEANNNESNPRRGSLWPLSAMLDRPEQFVPNNPPQATNHRQESVARRVRRRSSAFLRAVRARTIGFNFYNSGNDEGPNIEDLEAQFPRAFQEFQLCGSFFDFDPITQGFTPEELSDRREFIVVMAISLLKYGAATHLTEAFMDAVALALHVPAQCTGLPGFLTVSFNSPDMDPAKSQIRSLSFQISTDLDKVDEVDLLAGSIVTGECSFKEAKKKLYCILARRPPFNFFHVIIAFGVAASMASMMFFDGWWWEGLVTFFLGIWVGIINNLAGRIESLSCIQEFVSAFSAALVAQFLQLYTIPEKSCFFAMAMGSCVALLPGLSITTSVTELASRCMVSGSSRIFSAFATSLQLGFGITVGSRAVLWTHTTEKDSCTAVMPPWFQFVGFFCFISALLVLLQVRPAFSWTGVYVTAAVGYWSLLFFNTLKTLTSDTVSFLSAMAVGVVGSLFARYWRRQPVSIVICGILLLVPGGISIRGAETFISSGETSGTDFGMQMFSVALSVTIGLLVAKVLVVPATALARPYYQPAIF